MNPQPPVIRMLPGVKSPWEVLSGWRLLVARPVSHLGAPGCYRARGIHTCSQAAGGAASPFASIWCGSPFILLPFSVLMRAVCTLAFNSTDIWRANEVPPSATVCHCGWLVFPRRAAPAPPGCEAPTDYTGRALCRSHGACRACAQRRRPSPDAGAAARSEWGEPTRRVRGRTPLATPRQHPGASIEAHTTWAGVSSRATQAVSDAAQWRAACSSSRRSSARGSRWCSSRGAPPAA